MEQYVTKVRTEKGDLQIDYNALANKPTSLPANGGNSDTVGGKRADYFASASDVKKLEEDFNSDIQEVSKQLENTITKLSGVEEKLGDVSTTEFSHVIGVTSNIQTQLDGKAPSVHAHSTSDITSGVLPIERGGTDASNGADGLKNLFAAGSTILSEHQYGEELPEPGVAGRFFLKKVVRD